jgi:hypothetical protein
MVFKTNRFFFAELSRWEEAVAEKHAEFTKKLSDSRKEKGRRRSVCEVLWEFVSDDANAGEYIFLEFFDRYKVFQLVYVLIANFIFLFLKILQ